MAKVGICTCTWAAMHFDDPGLRQQDPVLVDTAARIQVRLDLRVIRNGADGDLENEERSRGMLLVEVVSCPSDNRQVRLRFEVVIDGQRHLNTQRRTVWQYAVEEFRNLHQSTRVAGALWAHLKNLTVN